MSLRSIRDALEARLAAMSPSVAIAYENVSFTPTAGTPYQRVNLLPANPDNRVHGSRTYFEIGVFQITLCYPSGTGPADAEERAALVRTQFKRGTTVVDGSVSTLVTNTPRVAVGFIDGDRFCIPVSVPFQAQITT